MSMVYPTYFQFETVTSAFSHILNELCKRLGADEPLYALFCVKERVNLESIKRFFEFKVDLKLTKIIDNGDEGCLLWVVEQKFSDVNQNAVYCDLIEKPVVESGTLFMKYEACILDDSSCNTWLTGKREKGIVFKYSSFYYRARESKPSVLLPLRFSHEAHVAYHHHGTSVLSWLVIPQNEVPQLESALRFWIDDIQRGIYCADAVHAHFKKKSTPQDLQKKLLTAGTRLVHQGCTSLLKCQNFYVNVNFLKQFKIQYSVCLQKPGQLLYLPAAVAFCCVTEGHVFVEIANVRVPKSEILTPYVCLNFPREEKRCLLRLRSKAMSTKKKCLYCELTFSRHNLLSVHEKFCKHVSN